MSRVIGRVRGAVRIPQSRADYEKYRGCTQRLKKAINDKIGLEPSPRGFQTRSFADR